jgi:predicted small secreted protein
MKKFLISLAIAFASFLFTGCNDPVQGIVYDVNIDGKATGDVVVTFPNGSLNLDGDAALAFKYSNDTTIVQTGKRAVAIKGLTNPELDTRKEVQQLYTTATQSFDVKLKNAEAGGTYFVHVHGYAKEPNTGIVVAIDKTFQYPPVNEEVTD